MSSRDLVPRQSRAPPRPQARSRLRSPTNPLVADRPSVLLTPRMPGSRHARAMLTAGVRTSTEGWVALPPTKWEFGTHTSAIKRCSGEPPCHVSRRQAQRTLNASSCSLNMRLCDSSNRG
eukprot:365052-Chlamydomonas_euryale.AAC.38